MKSYALLLPALVVIVCMLAFDRPSVELSCLIVAVSVAPFAVRLYLLEREMARRSARQLSFFQNFIDVIPQPVYVKDSESRYVFVNQAFQEDMGLPADQIVGHAVTEMSLAQPNNAEESVSEDREVLAGLRVTKEQTDHNGERHRVIQKGSCIGLDGQPVIVGANFDVTPWRVAETRLEEALANETAQRQRTESFIQRLIDVIPDPVFIKKGDGYFVMINDAFASYRDVDKTGFHRFCELSKNPKKRQISLDEDARVLGGEEIIKEDHTVRQSTGEEVYKIVSKRPCVFVDGDPVIVGVEHLITEWRLAERELKRLAEEDVLTGIANRRYFHAEAQRALYHAQRHGEHLALVLFDVDHFKLVNDEHGHNIGDEVLRIIAQRMRDCFRKSDLPGRWGGEEFVALLPKTVLRTALSVADRLRNELAASPVETSGGPLLITLSGGCAQLRGEDTLESLMARADAALYRAKHDGRNRVTTEECA